MSASPKGRRTKKWALLFAILIGLSGLLTFALVVARPAAATIGVNAGSGGETCINVATCSTNTIAVAANSVLLVTVTKFNTVITGETVADASAGKTYSPTDVETTAATAPLSQIWGTVITAATTVRPYVNFTTAAYYAVEFVDFTNTVITATYTSGVGTNSGSSTAATCSVTTTVTGERVFAVVGVLTTAEATIAPTGSEVQLLKQATTTNVVTQETQDGVDASTGAFSSGATLATTGSWRTACVGVKPAVVPGAPTGLTVGTMTTTTAPLTWTLVAAQAPYVIAAEISDAIYTGSCGTFSNVLAASSPFTSGTVTGLTSGTNYCFEVTDSNSTGASLTSTSVIGVTLHAPLAVTGVAVSAQAGTTTQLNVAWTLDTGTLANQTIHYTTVSTCSATNTGTFSNIADVSDTSFTITGLVAGTLYYVDVEAWNTTGQGAWSACASATTNANPSAPTGLASTGQTEFSVSLTWTNPSGGTPTNNTIYSAVATTCVGFAPTNAISLGVASSGTVTNLAPATEYCFEVALWSAAGTQAESTGLLATTLTGVPNAVTLFQNTAIGATTLTFTWSNPAPATGTIVNATLLYGTGCGTSNWGPNGNPGTWTHNVNLASAATTGIVTGLVADTSYCVNVDLWTQGGQGNQTISVNASTGDPVPTQVTGLTYFAASSTTVTMVWTQPSSAFGVLNDTVFYTTTSGCGGADIYISAGSTGSIDVGSLTVATSYYWEVSAWSSGGEGPWSSCVTGATRGATPPTPYNLAAQLITGTSVYITWINPSGYSLTDGKVYVSNANGICGTWAAGYPVDLGEVTQNYQVISLISGDTYCIQVSAIDGESPLSAPLIVTLPSTNGGGSLPNGIGVAEIGSIMLVGAVGLGLFVVYTRRSKHY